MKAHLVPTSVIYRKPAVESAGGVVAPAALDPADYPLTSKPTSEGFFG